MKKTLLVIVGLLILAAPAVFAQAYTANLAPLRVNMADAFEWSNGYQGNVATRALLSGSQLKVGETYTLKMKFTTSRDLEDELMVVFVDTTDKAKPSPWWSEATEYFLVGNDGEVIKGGKEYTSTITFTVTARTSSAAPSANALVFTTKGEGKPGPDPKTPGVKGSGVKKPFVISFTEFELTRK